MVKVLSWQKKSPKLVKQGFKYLTKRDALLRQSQGETEPKETELAFNLKKVSERYVKKFGATSYVYRAVTKTRFDLPDIMERISSQASCLAHDTYEKIV